MDEKQETLRELAALVKEEMEEIEREAQADANTGFVQLYRKPMRSFRKIIRGNPVAAEIFYFLLEHMDRGNSLACSYATLQEITGTSKSTITRAIKFLKKEQHLSVSKMGNCNVYHINADVAWTTWGNGKKYAKFNATIVIAESEQDDSLELDTTRHAKLG